MLLIEKLQLLFLLAHRFCYYANKIKVRAGTVRITSSYKLND